MNLRTPAIAAFLALAAVMPASGQNGITIRLSDMPGINDTFRLSIADNLLGMIDLDDTGPDFDWDYSKLPSLGQRVEGYVDPVFGTPLVYNITFSNFLDIQHFATLAAPNEFGTQFGFGPIQLTEVYDFYRGTQDFFANVGMGATINDFPLTSKMQPRDFIYRFPLSFGDTDESFSQFGFDIPGFGHFGQKLLRKNEVDGWGRLTTRFGTFDVIRVRTELSRTDTISLQGFGFDQPRPQEIQYKWLAKNRGIPLLQVNVSKFFGSEVVTDVLYQDSVRGFTPPGPFDEEEEEEEVDTTSSVGRIPGLHHMHLFPNPASDRLSISFYSQKPISLTAEAVDATGRLVAVLGHREFGMGHATWQLDLGHLPAGSYLLTLTDGNGARTAMRLMLLPR